MLMEAMRLSLLDQDRSAANAPSTSAPAAPSRIAASNSPVPSPLTGTAPLPMATDDTQRRRGGNSTLSTLTVPLANASNLIAMTTAGMPSSATRDNGSNAPTTPDEGGSSSALSSLRERLSSQSSSHRRVDSNPPPSTTLAAAIHANQTANAFLHPRSSESAGDRTSSEEPAASSTSDEQASTAPESGPERKDHQAVNEPTGGNSALAH